MRGGMGATSCRPPGAAAAARLTAWRSGGPLVCPVLQAKPLAFPVLQRRYRQTAVSPGFESPGPGGCPPAAQVRWGVQTALQSHSSECRPPSPPPAAGCPPLAAAAGWLNMARPRPAFVRLHPADDPSKLHPVFFGHPDEFVPQPDPSKAGGQTGVGCSRLGLVALRAGRVPQRLTRLHITSCRGPCSPAPDTGRIERWGLVTDTPDGEDEDDGHAAHMAVSSSAGAWLMHQLVAHDVGLRDDMVGKSPLQLQQHCTATVAWARRSHALPFAARKPVFAPAGCCSFRQFLERLMKSQSLYGYMGGLKLKKPGKTRARLDPFLLTCPSEVLPCENHKVARARPGDAR